MEDMVGSVEVIKWENLKGYVVICFRYVVDLYGMKVLEEGIEINKYNFMCFFVVVDLWKVDDLCECLKVNKVNIVFFFFYNEGSLL